MCSYGCRLKGSRDKSWHISDGPASQMCPANRCLPTQSKCQLLGRRFRSPSVRPPPGLAIALEDSFNPSPSFRRRANLRRRKAELVDTDPRATGFGRVISQGHSGQSGVRSTRCIWGRQCSSRWVSMSRNGLGMDGMKIVQDEHKRGQPGRPSH